MAWKPRKVKPKGLGPIRPSAGMTPKNPTPAWLGGTQGLETGAGLATPTAQPRRPDRPYSNSSPAVMKPPAWVSTFISSYQPGATQQNQAADVWKKKRQAARTAKQAAREASLPHSK